MGGSDVMGEEGEKEIGVKKSERKKKPREIKKEGGDLLSDCVHVGVNKLPCTPPPSLHHPSCPPNQILS